MRVTAISSACLALCVACDAANNTRGVVRRDSAGVAIVETPVSTWEDENGWTIDARPVLTIGDEDGAAPYLFASIVGAVRLGDGSILVADGQARDIRIFDPRGQFRKAFGRSGQGPGEFGDLSNLWQCGDRRLYALDRGRRRILEWSSAGVLKRDFPIAEPNSDRGPYRCICSPDGGLIVAGWGNLSALQGLTTSQMIPHVAPVWLLDSTATPMVKLGDFQIAERIFLRNARGGGSAGALPFGRVAQFAANGNRIVLGTAERLELLEFNHSGVLERILRGPSEDLSLNDSIFDLYVNGGTPNYSKTMALIRAEGVRLPPTFPAYTDIKVDPSGYVWLQRFAPPNSSANRWGVFAPNGVFLGHVSMPAGLTVAQIDQDQVIGMARDSLDVQRIQVHTLRRMRN